MKITKEIGKLKVEVCTRTDSSVFVVITENRDIIFLDETEVAEIAGLIRKVKKS